MLILGTAKGNRPSFTDAAPPEQAEPLVERLRDALVSLGVPTATGRFAPGWRSSSSTTVP
jgi:D-aminoacyl-tRNA deacylase